MDMSFCRPNGVNPAVWSSLFIDSTSCSAVFRQVVLGYLGSKPREPFETMRFILDFFVCNPALAEEFKGQIISLLDDEDSRVQDGAISVIVACRWVDQIPRLLIESRTSGRFFPACDALSELLREGEFTKERTAFVDYLLAVLSAETDLLEALAVWNTLVDALERGVAPLAAIFAVVGLPSVLESVRVPAIHRVLWDRHRGEVERAAPQLLTQLGDMLKDPSLSWSRHVLARVADLLVRITQSNASENARGDALEALIALSTRHKEAKERLDQLTQRASKRWYGEHTQLPWWRQLASNPQATAVCERSR